MRSTIIFILLLFVFQFWFCKDKTSKNKTMEEFNNEKIKYYLIFSVN